MAKKLAELFSALTHGVYVVGVASGASRNAFTAAWVMQVSFDPPLLALSINPAHVSYGMLQAGCGFTVNVLAAGDGALAEHFGRPASADKLTDIVWRPGRSGAPILADALAWFDCALKADHPAGDHRLVLGAVLDGGLQGVQKPPLNYRDLVGVDGSAALFPEDFPALE